MDKYFTIMIIPEQEKGVRSFRIPKLFFRSLAFITVCITILFGILAYDYWSILKQVYENKHLNMENRQLREQIQLFQMKINSLSQDIERIRTFEKKLRIITGLEEANKESPLMPEDTLVPGPVIQENHEAEEGDALNKTTQLMPQSLIPPSTPVESTDMESDPLYLELKNLYDKKIAANLGIIVDFQITKKWTDLSRKSFALASDYAKFDFKFRKTKEIISGLEFKVNELDVYLLDKNSILRSTPTLLPSNGWITSYFGHRISPYSGGEKMHEGLDVGAPYGTPIVAPADGVVTFSGEKPGFGKFVQIDHGYGMETIYAHSQRNLVKTGQIVKRGEEVARVGSTGYSTGPHLHYEVRVNGIAVDPLYFVLEM